uniref:Uncharacterized protein n=1 Tax=Anguilla anguilla TaxID=7936 RepID=A0A0E9VYE3_ANGAN
MERKKTTTTMESMKRSKGKKVACVII